MAFVAVPKDLSKIKPKVMLGLTKRQLVCFGIGIAVGVPLFFLLRGLISTNLATMVMIVAMLPFFVLGLYEKDGQPLEVVLGHIIQTLFLRPKQRPYRTDNYYAALMRQSALDKEVQGIVREARSAQRARESRTAPKGPKKNRKATKKKQA